jgi:hypothetical protein
VFSRNFCALLATNLKKADSYLHAMAKRIMVSHGNRVHTAAGSHTTSHLGFACC